MNDNNSLPLISIAMTTYNGELFIREQLDSIISQTYENLEIIICDDCSTDSTRDILNEYKIIDNRIKLFFNDVNLGFNENFNKAISLCNGDYIALSDQDDIWDSNKIQREYDVFKNNKIDFVCSNSRMIDDNGLKMGYTMKEACKYNWIPYSKNMLFRRLVFFNIVQGSTILASSKFLKSVPKCPADFPYYDWWYALYSCSLDGFYYYDECTLSYRQHSSNVTDNSKKEFKEELSIKTLNVESYEKYCQGIDSFVNRIILICNTIPFDEVQKKYIQKVIKYYNGLKTNTFYSFLFYAKNCKIMFLDRNCIRNLIRIARKFLGFLRWKIKYAGKLY